MNQEHVVSSGYVTPEIQKPLNRHFAGRTVVMDVSIPGPEVDALGFSYARLRQGEADVQAGRVLSLAEAADAVRNIIRANRG